LIDHAPLDGLMARNLIWKVSANPKQPHVTHSYLIAKQLAAGHLISLRLSVPMSIAGLKSMPQNTMLMLFSMIQLLWVQ